MLPTSARPRNCKAAKRQKNANQRAKTAGEHSRASFHFLSAPGPGGGGLCQVESASSCSLLRNGAAQHAKNSAHVFETRRLTGNRQHEVCAEGMLRIAAKTSIVPGPGPRPGFKPRQYGHVLIGAWRTRGVRDGIFEVQRSRRACFAARDIPPQAESLIEDLRRNQGAAILGYARAEVPPFLPPALRYRRNLQATCASA